MLRQFLEVFYLLACQPSSLAGAEATQAQAADAGPDQVPDGMAEPGEHPPDLPVPPFADGNLEGGA